MKRKLIIISVVAIAIIGCIWFGYSEYNRKVKDLVYVKAQIMIGTNELITAFEEDETKANALYLDKVIDIRGNVKKIESNEHGQYTIVLGDNGSMSSVRCSMDSTHSKDIASVKEGSTVTIKGACTGFNADELLGSDVILNRCVIENKD